MKTKTTLILLGGAIGIGFNILSLAINGYWNYENTIWLAGTLGLCAVIFIVDKIQKK